MSTDFPSPRAGSGGQVKTRAIVVLGAGAIMCLIVGALFITLAWVSGTHVITSVSHAVQTEFYGRSLVSLAVLFLSGVITLGNGVLMLKRGRPNQVLSFAMIGGFLVGIEMLREAASLLT